MNLSQAVKPPAPGHAASSEVHKAGLWSGEEERREGLEGCLEEGAGGKQPRAGGGSQQGSALDGRWVTMKGARRGPEPSPHSDKAGSRASCAPACVGHQRRLFKNCLPLSHTPAHPVFTVKAGDCGSFSPNGKGM